MFPLQRDSIFYTPIAETFYYNRSLDILKNISNLSTVGGRIKYYRLLNGLLQEDLSKKSGIDRATLIRYENNDVNHSLNICKIIARAIGINPDLLYDEYLSFIASDYGHKVKKTRKSNKLTQKELGNIIGVHRKTIVQWEKEAAYPTRDNYLMLKKDLI